MPTRPTPTSRRALAAAALALALGVGGWAAIPVGAQTDPVPSTEPAPSTEPVPTGAGGDVGTSTTAVGDTGADDAAVEDAQDQADADLRSVWVVVAALGVVAFGLLVLLVLYVRATNPERAARRRAALVARAEERRRARGDTGDEDADDAFRPFATAATAAGSDDDRTEVVAAVPAGAGAPALTRDPEGAAGEAVRVMGAPAGAAPGSAAMPESTSPPVTTGTGAGRRRATPLKAAPPGPGPAPAGPPPGPAEGDETVRIVPAPSGPTAVPASAGRGAVVATGTGATGGDGPPARALVDSPPPPRRPRRVDAPAKKLGTPDAERVLVRPGQAPVRVPPTMSRPGAAADGDATGDVASDAPPSTDDEAPDEEPGR